MAGLFPLFYFAVVIGIGLSRRRPVTGEADFFLARRSGGTVLLTGSLLATTLGSFGVMGLSGMAYSQGLVAGWYLWGGAFGFLILGTWVLGRIEIGDVFTLPELLGRSYGEAVRVFSAALIAIAWLGIIAAQLIAAGKIVHFLGTSSGWWGGGSAAGPALAIACTAAVFVVYTCLGGQHSILRTDLLQAFFIITAVGGLVISVFFRRPDILTEVDASFLRLPFNDTMTPGTTLLIVLTYGVPFLVGPDIYSRLFSGKGRPTAQRAVLLTAFFMIPMILGIVLAGVLGRAILGSGASDPDTILLEFASQAVTPLWGGMLMAALLAAVMSSADTCLLTISTLVSRDLLDTLLPRLRREETLVARSRWIILAAGAASLLVALALQDIVKALTICYQLYSPAVLCPFLALVIFRGRTFRPLTGMLAVGFGAGCAAIGIWADLPGLKLAAFGASALPFAMELFVRRGPAHLPPATKNQ